MYENYQRNLSLSSNKTKNDVKKSIQIMNNLGSFLESGEGKPMVSKLNSSYNFSIKDSDSSNRIRTFGVDLKNGSGKVTIPFNNADVTILTTADLF